MSVQSSPLNGRTLNSASGGDGPSAKKQRTHTPSGLENDLHGNQQYDEPVEDGADQDASAEGQDGSDGEAGPQLTEDFENMTDTVKAGIYMMQTRTQAIDEKVHRYCCSVIAHSFTPSNSFESCSNCLYDASFLVEMHVVPCGVIPAVDGISANQ